MNDPRKDELVEVEVPVCDYCDAILGGFAHADEDDDEIKELEDDGEESL